MNTITLSDDAYTRLKEWKRGPRQSFSRVVMQVVPKRGTLGQMVEEAARLPELSSRGARVMEEAAEWGRDSELMEDKWTS